MKNKWQCRVYIDLFAGSGRSRIKGTNRIVAGLPDRGAECRAEIDRYIFCERSPEKLRALETRVSRDYSAADVSFQPGDANESVDDILTKIPQHTKGFKCYSFCFVDPYNLKDLAFATIDRLSSRFHRFSSAD
jgi:three-Cys-motif partner protein